MGKTKDLDPAKSLSYTENTSCLQGNRRTSEFRQTKITLATGYGHSSSEVHFFSRSVSQNSHMLSKLILEPGLSLRTANLLYCYKRGRNLIILFCPSYLSFLSPQMDMTFEWPMVKLNPGPFGDLFHHLSGVWFNSHDLMHCRMPWNWS